MKIKKIAKYLTLLLMCVILNSCFIGKGVTRAKARKEFTEENFAIPPEFGDNNETVLIGILKGTRHYKRFLKKNFEKEYTGKYILIPEEDLYSDKFNDLNKYRYIFTYGAGTTTTKTSFSATGSYSSRNITTKKFYVYDRLKEIKYITGREFPYYAVAMQVYLEQLDKKRLHTTLNRK